jgi:hypothetical protein
MACRIDLLLATNLDLACLCIEWRNDKYVENDLGSTINNV